MQREEKQLDFVLDEVRFRLRDLKHSISDMIVKLETEYETIYWPTFLDKFGEISSRLTSITKVLAKDVGAAPLRNRAVLPLRLSQAFDTDLWKITEGKIPIFSHNFVPDFLRTKPEVGEQHKMREFEENANSLSPEKAMEYVAEHTKNTSYIYEMVKKAREEWGMHSGSKIEPPTTSSLSDTETLCAAVECGLRLGPSIVPEGIMLPPAPAPAPPPAFAPVPPTPPAPPIPPAPPMPPTLVTAPIIGKMNTGIRPRVKFNVKAAGHVYEFPDK